MNIKNIHHATALTSATVPIADPIDGLIKTADLNTPIPILVAVWEGSEPGYQCQLVLNDILTGEVRTLTDADQVGDMLPFELNEALLNKDDSLSLGYRVYSPDIEVANFAPTIPLRVDRTPPGASLLSAMDFP